ncbi:molecular chaperone GrpE [Aurantiacibacter atlanticus]|uniref:Protein GrpE n=1 Tax=Aurantiacibacter atlanticus TaxID=1648404 RepID=A0A0H4VCA5_9SPHN|nr:nucleotide exchange factor GrpE [Aurantiacibacter atlanticus]AKQ42277.1 molecular chaperone GrpE [Aurantiacibacter atlanticus]MDF1835410.1 nucleotide exchange factor GrpE [Alteraurantiacibacter sp. bin_em_oilr2.035]
MTHNDKDRDEAVEKELDGVPEEFLNDSDGSDEDTVEEETNRLDEALDRLREDLDAAKQEVLYSKAETQNVRRRMEKDITDARNYAATGFARDILSVADNLSRAIEAVPEDLREDSKFKGLVAGIQATQREMEKAFEQHGITRIAAMGLPLDPNQHQAMMEIPNDEVEPGTIVQEMQAGYMIKDRLLRPAMVGVAKKPD